MANQEQVQSISLPAAADYSTTGIYRFMDIAGASVATKASVAGQMCIGVLQNNPEAGQAAEVAFSGKVKVIAGATVAVGASVQADANAAGITAASGDHVQGICIVGGDVGELLEVLLVSQFLAP